MKASRIRTVYPSLTGGERFRLAMLAEARGDRSDRDHLFVTCPVMRLRGRDPDFSRPAEASIELAGAYLLGIAPSVGAMEALELIRKDLARAVAILVDTEDPLEPAEFPFTIMEVAWRHAAGVVRSAFEGLERACEEGPGLDPEVVLAAHAPFLAEHPIYQAALKEGEADDALSQEAYEHLIGIWRAKTGPPAKRSEPKQRRLSAKAVHKRRTSALPES